jgi:hypothetical protein
MAYSALDRLVHAVAFAGPGVQLTAADLESTMLAQRYRDVAGTHPIFITGLARAGSTILLEALSRFPTLASPTYRDMPLVLAPLLWSQISGLFRRGAERRERAQGDGVTVDYDSPEAFEEVFWKAFWKDKYAGDRVQLWTAVDLRADAVRFFAEYMKKVIALHRPDHAADGRYLAKNNGNLARLDVLGQLAPGAGIVVPMRNPLEHAASLLRQHRNFLGIHRKDPFARRYMADLGHYEFGALHKPIAFPRLDELVAGRDVNRIDYWLGYWIAAYDHVRRHCDSLVIVVHERQCADPRAGLERLCARLQIAGDATLDEAARLFRAAPALAAKPDDANASLVAEADALYADLAQV